MRARVLLFVALVSLGSGCPNPPAARITCDDDRQCSEGRRCDDVTRSCIEITTAPLVDGGALDDAGSSDAGASDAGQSDAGPTDAGPSPEGDGGADDGGSLDDDAGFFCPPSRPCVSLIDFLPALAKRPQNGAFDVAILVQNDPVEPRAGTGDVVGFAPGGVIAPGFASHVDTRQGTVMVWITLEAAPWQLAGKVALFDVAGVKTTLLPGGDVEVALDGAPPVTFSGAASHFLAGQPHLVVVRWDREGEDGPLWLDTGTGTLIERVGTTEAPAPRESCVGCSAQAGAAGALVGGLVVWRRPLFDGTRGVDLGHGDEIGRLLSGEDPSHVSGGSWDVVFALVTDQTPSPLDEASQAWSHPHEQNLLGTSAWLYDVEALTPHWTLAGDASVSSTAASYGVYGGGVSLTATSGYMERSLPVTAGESFVLRVLANRFTAPPLVRVAGRTTTDAIVGITQQVGGNSNVPTAPEEIVLAFDAPADVIEVTVQLGPSSPGAVAFHQVELYANEVANPSFSRWTSSGGFNLPEGWTQESGLPNNFASAEPTNVHSPESSAHLVADLQSPTFLNLRVAPAAEDHRFYAAGGHFQWVSGEEPIIDVTNGSLFDQTQVYGASNSFKMDVSGVAVPDTWQRIGVVGRRLRTSLYNAQNDLVRWGASYGNDTDLYVDDGWFIALSAPSVIALPASASASTTRNLLRIDGADVATQPLSLVSASEGALVTRVLLGREVGAPLSCGALVTIIEVSSSAGESLRFGADGDAARLRASVFSNAGSGSPDDAGTLPATEIEAVGVAGSRVSLGALHEVELTWSYPGHAVAFVEGQEVVRLPLPGAFVTAPNQVRFGSSAYESESRCDLSVQLPGVLERAP